MRLTSTRGVPSLGFESLESRLAMDVSAAVNLEQLTVTGTDMGEEISVTCGSTMANWSTPGHSSSMSLSSVLEGGNWISKATFDHVSLSSVVIHCGFGGDILWFTVSPGTSFFPTADIYGDNGDDVLPALSVPTTSTVARATTRRTAGRGDDCLDGNRAPARLAVWRPRIDDTLDRRHRRLRRPSLWRFGQRPSVRARRKRFSGRRLGDDWLFGGDGDDTLYGDAEHDDYDDHLGPFGSDWLYGEQAATGSSAAIRTISSLVAPAAIFSTVDGTTTRCTAASTTTCSGAARATMVVGRRRFRHAPWPGRQGTIIDGQYRPTTTRCTAVTGGIFSSARTVKIGCTATRGRTYYAAGFETIGSLAAMIVTSSTAKRARIGSMVAQGTTTCTAARTAITCTASSATTTSTADTIRPRTCCGATTT